MSLTQKLILIFILYVALVLMLYVFDFQVCMAEKKWCEMFLPSFSFPTLHTENHSLLFK